MDNAAKPGGPQPRIIIFSESGPLGGDLTACLSGRFAVERVTSLAGMGLALEKPAAALLVVPDRPGRRNPQSLVLIEQAVNSGCRVFLLGCERPDMAEELKNRITILPQFPSPEQLFAGLQSLSNAAKKAEG